MKNILSYQPGVIFSACILFKDRYLLLVGSETEKHVNQEYFFTLDIETTKLISYNNVRERFCQFKGKKANLSKTSSCWENATLIDGYLSPP